MSAGSARYLIWCAKTFSSPFPGRHARDGRGVGGQRDRRQRALADDDRVHELDGHVLRVRARRARAEDEELAALVEPQRHRMRGAGDLLGLVGELTARAGPALERRGATPRGSLRRPLLGCHD